MNSSKTVVVACPRVGFFLLSAKPQARLSRHFPPRNFPVDLLPGHPLLTCLFDAHTHVRLSQPFTMFNAEGENIELYIPRKCSWTNRLIEAKDHAAVQINVGHLDQSGVYNGQYTTLALSGYVRNMVRNDVQA